MSGVRRLPDAALDILLLVALGTVTLAGLATSFTGSQFLVVGVLGLLAGAGLAVLTTARRWPFVAAVLLALVAFYLVGGMLALRSADAVLPGPHAWGLLTDQVLYGWKDLLTTLPPLDGTGPLLVLPWFLGLTAGVLGMLLARVDRGPAWLTAPLPLLAPVALATGVILIGIERPQSLLLQGSVFSVLALVWLGVRVRRRAGVIEGRGGRVTRLAGASALVAVAGVLALPVGTWATGDDHRLILRDHVEPPFDIGQYASPLSSFRRYVEDESAGPANVYEDPLFRMEGLEPGTRVRIAALDTYDGVVWGAGADAVPGSTSDTFRRVSSEIHNPAPGDEVDAEVRIEQGYSGPWLPTVGALQELRFTEGDVDAKADSFRYNLATSTAVVPSGLRPGDRYTFRAAAEERLLRPEDAPASLVTAPVQSGFLAAQAVQWSAGESQSMAQVFAIADELRRTGKYSDGVANAERIYHAGHHVRRLGEEFANAPIMAGNDEQYAAVMALLANHVGVPARVVMGATVPEGGVVHGRDVSAWVEVQVADGSWRTLPTEAFMDFDKPAETPPRTQEQLSGKMVPPPAPIPPPSTAGEQTDAELNPHRNRRGDGDDDGFSLPGWLRAILVYVGFPLLVLAAIAGAIIGAKAWRRRRRRTHLKVSARFVGAWRELVDHARDLGTAVPHVGTRREQALLLATDGAPVLARRADQHVFGPAVPADDEASAYWEAVDAERAAMSAGVPRARRWLAAVDVRTFFRR
jgi:hypothetical protein